MEELLSFLQSYSEILTGAAIIVMGLLLLIFSARILKQIKRLNQSLKSITDNMQAYFDVILQEDSHIPEEPEEPVRVPEAAKSETVAHEEPAMDQELKKQQEEEVFNAVLQEYFS